MVEANRAAEQRLGSGLIGRKRGDGVSQRQDERQDPPRSTEVVVIGGGIAGCATAYFLAKRGVPVVLLEKGRIAGEQSSRNWGWVRKQGRDPRELPAIIESLRIWQGLEEELSADLGWRRAGVTAGRRRRHLVGAVRAPLPHARLDRSLGRAGGFRRRKAQALVPQPGDLSAARRHGRRLGTVGGGHPRLPCPGPPSKRPVRTFQTGFQSMFEGRSSTISKSEKPPIGLTIKPTAFRRS